MNAISRRLARLEAAAGSGVVWADRNLLLMLGLPETARVDLGAVLRAVDGRTRGLPCNVIGGAEMSAIGKRLRQLEQSIGGGRAMMHVLEVHESDDRREVVDATLKAAGISEGPHDLVVVVRRFFASRTAPRLVSSSPMRA